MAELEPWLRMIKIVQHLVRREALTVRDLYTIFGGKVAIRALQRDMEKLLAEPSIPVELVPDQKGREHKYYIEPWFKTRFARSALDLNEALAGKIIAQSLGVFRHTPLEKNIKNFEEKFSSLIPNDIFESTDHKMEELASSFASFQMGMYDYAEKGDLIVQLLNNLPEHRLLKMQYTKPNTHQPTEYLVFPLKMVQYRGSLYIYAKKKETNEIRLFVVHRIEKVEEQDETLELTPKLKKDLRQRERRAMGIYEENRLPAENIELKFSKEIAHRIKGRMWHASQKVTSGTNGTLTMKLKVPVTEELISWILWWQTFVKVIKPAALKKEISSRAGRIARLYNKTS